MEEPCRQRYVVDIQGSPHLYSMMLPIPALDFPEMTKEAMQALGMAITAMPAVNAIPAVCASAPGIVTYKHLAKVSAADRYKPSSYIFPSTLSECWFTGRMSFIQFMAIERCSVTVSS